MKSQTEELLRVFFFLFVCFFLEIGNFYICETEFSFDFLIDFTLSFSNTMNLIFENWLKQKLRLFNSSKTPASQPLGIPLLHINNHKSIRSCLAK